MFSAKGFNKNEAGELSGFGSTEITAVFPVKSTENGNTVGALHRNSLLGNMSCLLRHFQLYVNNNPKKRIRVSVYSQFFFWILFDLYLKTR